MNAGGLCVHEHGWRAYGVLTVLTIVCLYAQVLGQRVYSLPAWTDWYTQQYMENLYRSVSYKKRAWLSHAGGLFMPGDSGVRRT